MNQLNFFDDYSQEEMDRWILNYINNMLPIKTFEEFFTKNKESIRSEGVFRLCQSLINLLYQPIDLMKYKSLFEKFMTYSSITVHELMQIINKAYQEFESKIMIDWIKHRNICFVVMIVVMLDKSEDLLDLETSERLFVYILKLFDKCEFMETILWAILMSERVCLKKRCFENREKLQKTLKNLKAKLESKYYDPMNETFLDVTRYQVGFAARWCVDNILDETKEPQLSAIPQAKLLPDRMTVQNCSILHYPVRSSFAITSGVYYYEVICLTNGDMSFGWCSNDVKLTIMDEIGDDRHSIGFNAARGIVRHNGETNNVKMPNKNGTKAGDVIGCFINFEKRQFVFFINGQNVGDFNMEYSQSQSYFACASLASYQHCMFNFGQTKFKYPTNDLTLCCDSKAIDSTYCLMQTESSNGLYWFKQPVDFQKNEQQQFYTDTQQNKFDSWLKELATKVLLNNFISESDFDENFHVVFQTLMKNEQSCCRLMQSIYFYFGEALKNQKFDILVALIESFCQTCPTIPLPTYARFIEIIHLYIQHNSVNENFNKTRNICIVLAIMCPKFKEQNYFLTDEVFGLIVKTLDKSQDRWSVLFSLIYLEKLFNKKENFLQLNIDQQEEIERLFRKLADNSKIPFENGFDNLSHSNAEEIKKAKMLTQQIRFCAQWCIDNIIENYNNSEIKSKLKLSADKLTARYDENDWISVRSSFAVAEAKSYFYEVTLQTCGEVRVGWTTWESRMSDKNKIGDDEYSIGLDVSKKCVWHKKQFEQLDLPSWRPGDVIGCLIDMEAKKFEFYYNGQIRKCLSEYSFSSWPYYATASLTTHQQCFFNFGQIPFSDEHLLKNVQNFHQECKGNRHKYCLMEPIKAERYYWFNSEVVDNRVKPFYPEISQEESANVIRTIKNEVQNLKIESVYLPKDEIEFKRSMYLRCIIEVLEIDVEKDKVDTYVRWLGHYLKSRIEWTSEKMYELIYPYLQLQILNSTDVSRHRNFCIILLNTIKYCQHNGISFIKPIRKEIFNYLARTLNESTDKWTMLIALIAVEGLDIENNEQKRSDKMIQMSKFWECYYEQIENVYELLQKHANERVGYQLYLCAKWFNGQYISKKDDTEEDPQSTIAMQQCLNPNDKSSRLKLSPDLFSARSDWTWQNVRSLHSASSNIFYYEVVLLTNGPMRIGWATKETIIEKFRIGNDEHSIALNLYNQCVWHNNEKQRISLDKWKAGDIISCVIDISSEKFNFYLNGERIVLLFDPYFSSNPYYATIGLGSHQQVYANFGQVPFKYPNLGGKISHSKIPNNHNALILNKSQINFNHSNRLINAIINVSSSLVRIDNVSFKRPQLCPVCKQSAPSYNTLELNCCELTKFCPKCSKKSLMDTVIPKHEE